MPQKYSKQFPCRCNNCRARRTLRHHPKWYVNRSWVKCWKCKQGELVVDVFRLKKEHKKYECQCNGLHYNHRKGSSIQCIHNPINKMLVSGEIEPEEINYLPNINDI